MASYLAIAAVAKGILQSLSDACPRSEFATAKPGFDVYASDAFGTPMEEGFSIHLLRQTVNSTLRNSFPRRDSQGNKIRPSLPVDLLFLLTPWAKDPTRQLRLLGWAMRHMEDNPILSASVLNVALKEETSPVFDPDEAVELVLDPLAYADHLGVWDKFKPKLPPSLYYSARMVRLDSMIKMEEFAPVEVRDFSLGRGLSGGAP